MTKKHPVECILDLAEALGVKDISSLPGAWVYRVDDTWTVAVNGQDTTVSVKPEGCMSVNMEPFEFFVWFDGWLAGIMLPGGNGEFAEGTLANQEEFDRAITKGIRCLRPSEGGTTNE